MTITGTNLTGATAVSFGGTAATGVSVVNATTVNCTSPAHAAGTIDVTVTTPGGTSATTGTGNDYTYTSSGGAQIFGVVQGNDPGVLAGATVKVVLDAVDPNYNPSDPNGTGANLVGQATTDSGGNYTINVSSFRGTGLAIGSIVDVTGSASNHLSVTQYGAYDKTSVECSS